MVPIWSLNVLTCPTLGLILNLARNKTNFYLFKRWFLWLFLTQHLGQNMFCIVEGNHSWVFLCWPPFRCPWSDLVWETLSQITAIPNSLSTTVTVGPSVFQIRTLWRCSLGLSGGHLTEVIFHFSCQPGLEGPSASLSRQHKRRMWWTESLFQSRCFQVDTTEAETTFCHWGPTNRDCAVMMWPQTDPRVEAINSN